LVVINDDPFYEHWLRGMNNCGQVVYSSRLNQLMAETEIFLYDNGALVRITDDNVRDDFPDINDSGIIVWTSFRDGTIDDPKIAVRKDGATVYLGDGEDAKVNSLGHIAWKRANEKGCFGSGFDVLFYTGSLTTFEPKRLVKITNNDLSNQQANLNDHDEIVWTQYNFCPDPWESRIMLYADGVAAPVSGDDSGPQSPDINNLGHVMWGENTNGSGVRRARLWTDGFREPVTLIDPGNHPHPNNLGDVTVNRMVPPDDTTWQVWLLPDAAGLTEPPIQVTSEPISTRCNALNDWGEMLLDQGVVLDTNVLVMRRIRTGEADFDGHIDLRDFAAFQNCITGPGDFDGTEGGFDRLCDCRFLDIDHDRDVDADDFALFQPAMDGPL
ncbi:MAG: hypothetical protein ACE5EX_10700, partial [Phycisphaerae bacterium]